MQRLKHVPFSVPPNDLQMSLFFALTAMLGHCVVLQLSLKKEFLWALCAVIDLVLLSMSRKNMLLQLVCLNKYCKTDGAFKCASHSFKAVLNKMTLEFCWGVK